MIGLEIAVIGMACRFPGAENLDAFWQNLQDGVESIARFSEDELRAAGVAPEHLNDPAYVNARGILPDIEYFDASFFGYSPREAELMDPQQRIFLEEAWKTLEHTGYNPETYTGAIGVYAGLGMNTYLLNNLAPNTGLLDSANAYQMMIGNNRDFLTTRVSYKFNLRGPGVTVQAACSTSLVAIHFACRSLLMQECDLALAGGVTIVVPQHSGYLYQEGMILSPDGHCRAFDAEAQGTVGGNGVGLVALKRITDALEDGDSIHAVIKSSAINNDGALKIGYTAPGVEGQASVIEAAQAIAEIEPDTIGYIEAHGTGTRLGDPIEIRALTQAFRRRTQKTGFCAIGSVKTNVGHLDAAAGVAGFIKTVLMLKHQHIPPSLHFQRPNPELELEKSPFYVNTQLAEWQPDGFPRRAGVSSFGIGGTNAHVVLEEFETRNSKLETRSSEDWQLLVLSAKTETALNTAAANLAAYLRQHLYLNLADAAYTLQVGRKHFEHRRIVLCRSLEEAIQRLGTFEELSEHSFLPGLASRLLETGKIWSAGSDVDWPNFAHHAHRRIPLPTYPFERQHYWIEPPHSSTRSSRVLPLHSTKPTDGAPRNTLSVPYGDDIPRDEYEEQIAAIWADVLGIEQIGMHDDFFELGGDSLLAIQLISRLRDLFHVTLSDHSLIHAPTIAMLSEFIEQTYAKRILPVTEYSPSSLLVEMYAGDTRFPPLFMVHPVGGHVYFYRDLIRHLHLQQPIYGIQAHGLDGTREPLMRVEDMAACYLEAIRKLQPEGPYYIGGASFGGTVAFEMAQQLLSVGQTVAFVAMLDTPGTGHMPVKLSDDADILAYLLEVGAHVSVSCDEIRQHLETDEQFRSFLHKLPVTARILPRTDVSQVRTLLHLFKAHVEAMLNYTPQDYPGRITFFCAKERDAFNAHHPELAWLDVAIEGINIFRVPGNHITMNYPPHVQILADRLRQCLLLAQSVHTS